MHGTVPHMSPKILILITLFLRKADLELKISPPELKTKTYFKKKFALGNRAGVGEKRDGKPFIFVISPSIILVVFTMSVLCLLKKTGKPVYCSSIFT